MTSTASLRQHCAASLAGYKVPARIVTVDRLPRNANTGKVQRRDVAALFTAVEAAERRPMTESLRVAAVQFELRAEATFERFAGHLDLRRRRSGGGGRRARRAPELVTTGLLAAHPDAASLGRPTSPRPTARSSRH